MRFFILPILALLTFIPNAQSASPSGESLKASYKKMEDVLQNRQNPQELINFMHDFISEEASFRVAVQNPTMKDQNSRAEFEISKADYINSFLQGARFIEAYDVEVRDIKVLDQTDELIWVEHVMIERGVMKDPKSLKKAGQNFTTKTICRSQHAPQSYQILDSHCATSVQLEQII